MENKILKPLTSNIKKYRIAVFDIEANNWTDFLILGFFDGENYYEFYDIEKFLDFVLRLKYRGFKIFAHYAGRYDFLFLLEHLKQRASLIDVNGKIIQIKANLFKLQTERSYIYFCDSFALLPNSLEKLSYAFDVKYKKLKMDFSKKLIINNRLKKYLKYDCLALYEILVKFQDEINNLGGQMKLTIASTAMDIFRRKYLNIAIPSHKHIEDFIRLGYYGGRVEVFKKYFNASVNSATNKGKYLYDYDFNSLYPSVMQDNTFPVGNPSFINNYRYNRNDVGFAEIETHIPHNIYIPPLPYRLNEMLIFPTGHLQGVYPFPYINVLEALNIPYKINKAYLFDRADLFSDFVNDVYYRRLQNKDNVKSYILKILANSLYGKFAQKRERREFIIIPDQDDLKKGLHIYNNDVDLWFNDLELDSAHILPAISAYVTAYAHIKLFNNLKQYSNSIYYCDTDSLFTTCHLPTSLNLGSLKLEDQIQEAIFINPKCYAYINLDGKEIIKAKGFSREELNFNSFKKVLFKNDLSDFNQTFKKMYGFKSALNSIANKNKSYLYYADYKKSLKSFDLKREFNYFNSVPIKVQ